MSLPSNPSKSFIAANPHLYGHHSPPEIPDAKPQSHEGQSLEKPDEGAGDCAGIPRVCFTLRRVKLLDVDAKFASVKDVLDGLHYAGLIPGDAEGEITLEVRQEKVPHYADEETVISIVTAEKTCTARADALS